MSNALALYNPISEPLGVILEILSPVRVRDLFKGDWTDLTGDRSVCWSFSAVGLITSSSFTFRFVGFDIS